MLNEVKVIGHLGADPEIRYMPNGTPTALINVATSSRWKDRETGESKEKTEWHRIVFFDKLAEIAGEYLKKGALVYIGGRLQTRPWTDKQGVKRYTTEIVAETMRMLDKNPATEANPTGNDGPPTDDAGLSQYDSDQPF